MDKIDFDKIKAQAKETEEYFNTWGKYPMAMSEAVSETLLHMSDETKRLVANSPKYMLVAFHLTLGLAIRNGLGLWNYFPNSNNADAESHRILEALWESLQSDKRYRDVLRNPETGDELPEELKNVDIMQYWKRKSHYDSLVKEFMVS